MKRDKEYKSVAIDTYKVVYVEREKEEGFSFFDRVGKIEDGIEKEGYALVFGFTDNQGKIILARKKQKGKEKVQCTTKSGKIIRF